MTKDGAIVVGTPEGTPTLQVRPLRLVIIYAHVESSHRKNILLCIEKSQHVESVINKLLMRINGL